jgi:regulator of sigma E protease
MDLGTLYHVVVIAVVMIVMICVLVAAHEYGHYLFARIFGMGVEEFAIGFGKPKLWTWLRKTYDVEPIDGPAGAAATEQVVYPVDGSGALQPQTQPAPAQVMLGLKETTDFTIRPWPLGGFVRIKGMIPEDDGSETKVPGGFYSKAPWKRFIVLFAGPVFSVIAGIIILFLLKVTVGEDRPTTTLKEVLKDGPAFAAGLKPGDKILQVGELPISSPFDVAFALRDRAGKPVEVSFDRAGTRQSVTLTPVLEEKESPVLDRTGTFTGELRKQGKMMAAWNYEKVSVPADRAFRDSARFPFLMIAGLAGMAAQPSQFKENVGGPISIAMATSDAVKNGAARAIELAALLSISVGIFNLLPIPPLDGGQMLVAFAEMLRGGKRLSIKVQGALTAAGLAMVLMLFVSVMMIDIGRLGKSNDNPAKPAPSQPKK